MSALNFNDKRVLVVVSFLIGFATLGIETLFLRVYDALFHTTVSLFVITCAISAFGFAGFAYYRLSEAARERLFVLSLPVTVIALFSFRSLMNALQFSFDFTDHTRWNYLLMLAVTGLIFFGLSYFLITIYEKSKKSFNTLYASDLIGGAFGVVAAASLVTQSGLNAGFSVFSSILVLSLALLLKGKFKVALLAISSLIFGLSFVLDDTRWPFEQKLNKKVFERDASSGEVELSFWDPVSKVDVYQPGGHDNFKIVYLEGGTLASFIYKFDGDLQSFKESIDQNKWTDFWSPSVAVSHRLKKDIGAESYLIGAGGGQEIKAALAFGATKVDVVDLVPAFEELSLDRYAEYNGGIFNHPAVNYRTVDGRVFLRENQSSKYDIIQIFSAHIASQIGSLIFSHPLITVESFQEFYGHLKQDGILHLDMMYFPKLIQVAGEAWKRVGNTEFRKHVVVIHRDKIKYHQQPTVLIKMSPWTEGEISLISDHFEIGREGSPFKFFENPLEQGGYLSQAFFDAIEIKELPFTTKLATDDWPYYFVLAKNPFHFPNINELTRENFITTHTAITLTRKSYFGFIQQYSYQVSTGFVLLILVLISLALSFVTRKSRGKGSILTSLYFSCIGAGFILAQMYFMSSTQRVLGLPNVSLLTVLVSFLVFAGLGSLVSKTLHKTLTLKWTMLLAVISLSVSGALVLGNPGQFYYNLSFEMRVAICTFLISVPCFFMGMAMPGALTKWQDDLDISWAWFVNGIATAVGGFAAIILAVFIGFSAVLATAVLLYLVAALVVWKNRLA